MAAVVRARNELVRVAIQIDPPKAIGRPRRLSTIDAIQLIMFAASKIEEGVLSYEAFKQVYVSQVGSGTNFGDIAWIRF